MGEGSWGDLGVAARSRSAARNLNHGEKPVGYSLLQAISRSEALPPKLSARTVPSLFQVLAFLGLVALGCAAVRWQPGLTLSVAGFTCWFAFILIVLWRFCLVIVGAGRRFGPSSSESHAKSLPEELPVYSILIALRHEAGMMPQLATSLSALDWPAGRLDILLLIEADDTETMRAARDAAFPTGTRVIRVPPGKPLTKPRALNYGLARAVGEYLTIYDAEDRPDPQQLKAACAMFEDAPANVLCLQAPLKATNGASSWVAAHWALEYDVQFNLYLPALASWGHPIMLGGTSNHFRRLDLIAFGGWDAWNVTEDADLGLRAARLGGQTWRINTPTLESAPETYSVWFHQRKRWIKGYMQTWLVCMRRPFSLLSELGFPAWVSLQMTLGASILSAFLYGPMTLWMLAGLIVPAVQVDALSFALFGLGWIASTLGDALAPGRWRFARTLAVVSRPFYWMLQTGAAIMALYGLAVRPHFWAKTPHQPEQGEAASRADIEA